MAEVLLFHHAQGQTEEFAAFADELRRAGHTVHTPDLFDGRTFATIEEGMAYAQQVGFPEEIIERGAGRERAAQQARLRRFLARRAAGAEARPDAPRRARGAAVLRLRAREVLRPVAGGRAGADPRDGRRPDLRRRGRPRRRPRDRRVDRAGRALPLPRRPALFRRLEPVLRRQRRGVADPTRARLPAKPLTCAALRPGASSRLCTVGKRTTESRGGRR